MMMAVSIRQFTPDYLCMHLLWVWLCHYQISCQTKCYPHTHSKLNKIANSTWKKRRPMAYHPVHQCWGIYVPTFQRWNSIFLRPNPTPYFGKQVFTIPGYLPLIAKHGHLNHHGFVAYIKYWFPHDWDAKARTMISCIRASAWHLPTIPHLFSLSIVIRIVAD